VCDDGGGNYIFYENFKKVLVMVGLLLMKICKVLRKRKKKANH